jgi:hypothetical protein
LYYILEERDWAQLEVLDGKENKLSLLDLINENQSLNKLRVHSLPADKLWKISIIEERALIDDNCLESILEVSLHRLNGIGVYFFNSFHADEGPCSPSAHA